MMIPVDRNWSLRVAEKMLIVFIVLRPMRAAILFLVFVCFNNPVSGQDASHVVLVSFDGFRYDYVQQYNASNFKNFIRKGSSARGLIPSFPSKTFPNHYTLVTGLYPGNHGLVDNNFYDTDTQVHFTSKNKKAVTDSSYYGGIPLWQLAKQNGMKSASYFWVGSEVVNAHPDYYYAYDEKVPDSQRVDQVLKWLSLPVGDRPRFIALYFSVTDDYGHQFGPNSEQVRNAVLHADSLLGQLMRGIAKTEVPVNVIIVSDHGMKRIEQRESSYLLLPEIVPATDESTKIVNSGSHVHVYQPDPEKKKALYNKLTNEAMHFNVLTKEELPERWHYKSKRVGDILLTAQAGYYFMDFERSKLAGFLKPWGWSGVHGYDPSIVPEMNGIFYANGPNIRPGYTLDAFENIHVYPFVARILGLPLPTIDGRREVLEKVYQSRPQSKASSR
jgi:predicted AlkP superfamily pyrophosphatase or phosphodiesterase